jgi:hypothetical protein
LDSLYREAVAADVLVAPTRVGEARLELAPNHTVLTVGSHLRVTVTKSEITVQETVNSKRRRKPKVVTRSLLRRDHRLIVAQRFRTEDVSLWHSEGDEHVRRWFGFEPVVLLDLQAVRAWRDLDVLRTRFFEALIGEKDEATGATEYGEGRNRALVIDYPGHSAVWAKPMLPSVFPSWFRKPPTKLFEVHRDGSVIRFRGTEELGNSEFNSKFAVTVTGDRIHFSTPKGDAGESLFLPWVAPEERDELKLRFSKFIE